MDHSYAASHPGGSWAWTIRHDVGSLFLLGGLPFECQDPSSGWSPPIELYEGDHGLLTALRASIWIEGQRIFFLFSLGVFDGLCNLFSDEDQVALLSCSAEYAIVPDAGKPLGQYVHGKSAHELCYSQCHRLVFTTLSIVLVCEGNGLVIDRLESMLTDGNAMGVSP